MHKKLIEKANKYAQFCKDSELITFNPAVDYLQGYLEAIENLQDFMEEHGELADKDYTTLYKAGFNRCFKTIQEQIQKQLNGE